MPADRLDIALQIFCVLETGNATLAAQVVAPDNYNATAAASPLGCQISGPAGVVASSSWLRSAFADLAFTVKQSAVGTDTVWLRMSMKGTHTGPFVRFANGKPAQVIPPTHRRIDVEQIHLVTVRDGRVVRHEALRDDLGMLDQLGVFPPTSTMLAMVAWRLMGRAMRAARAVSAVTAKAAAQASAGHPPSNGPNRAQIFYTGMPFE